MVVFFIVHASRALKNMPFGSPRGGVHLGPKCFNLLFFELFSRTDAALKNLTFMMVIVKILTWRPSSERPVDQPTGLPREVQNRPPFWTAPGANFWRPLGPNGPFWGSPKPKKLSRSPPEAPKMTSRRPPQLRTRSGPPLDTILGPFWDHFGTILGPI